MFSEEGGGGLFQLISYYLWQILRSHADAMLLVFSI